MFKKILLTTDGSQLAEDAMPVAIDLARQTGAQLRVVTVVENPVFYGTPEATALYDAEFYRTLSAELDRMAQNSVERVVAAAARTGLKPTSIVRHGSPSEEILAEAKEWGADCVVIATHGRSGLGRLLLGSVANRIVNHATCPVLLFRGQAREK